MLARLAVWFVPFRRLASRLGNEMAESPATDTKEQRGAAASIGWAIRTLGRRLPLMNQCLVQGIAAIWMLQRRRTPTTLYFGLAKDEEVSGELKAHAWVHCGEKVLTGAKGYQDYRVVASFASPDLGSEPARSVPVEDDFRRRDAAR